ncbi:MAG: hypothetical protein JST43_11475 [Bacteroidetes bacterium]|nr:hypothetical protein [Bacteroidota bacterium]MBS1541673.1 hypothetical protein [Bacteroidota bacterium]
MFFDNYKLHSEAQFNPALFWEYDQSRFDFTAQTALVVQRVIERGASEDFYAMLNLYGIDKVVSQIKEIPSLSQREIEFISNIFSIPYNDMKAYKNLMLSPSLLKNSNQKIRI